MKKKLLYILGITAAMLTSCSDEVMEKSDFLNGSEKTPITVSALMDMSNATQTRAVDMEFEQNDQLIAYLRHVTWDGTTGARTNVAADNAPQLVTFTKGEVTMTAYAGSDITPIGTGVALGLSSSNTQQTADLTASPALYWDDFSNSAKGDTDLRTSGHYLESYYGYCYNGGTPNTGTELDTDKKKAAGTIGWTVNADQFTNGIKTSDLLWSAEQTPIRYAHVDADGNRNHGTLILPYTHAMSKVTLEIVLDEGFDINDDNSATAFGTNSSDRTPTTPTLFANRVTTTTAPTYTHSTTVASGDAAKIQMRLADDEATTKKARVYEAIIAPTVMKAGNKLAEVTVDGNKYDIILTDAVLTTIPTGATAAWNGQLKAYTIDGTTLTKNSTGYYDASNGGITLPGVNYRIKVTLNKQEIKVEAYIKNWEDVNATATGTIMFDADIVTNVTSGVSAVTAGDFDLWRAVYNSDATPNYDANADGSDGITKASTYTYTTDKWVGNPTLYWANASTSYYFRALATTTNNGATLAKLTDSDIDSSTKAILAKQDKDLLWAQTSRHTGKDAADNTIQENGSDKVYEAGDPINPRTGNVPLTFEHAMSKITVALSTPTGDDAVNLTGAKIDIINTYNGGSIDIHTGDISSLTKTLGDGVVYTFSGVVDNTTHKLENQIVIPQSLTTYGNPATPRNDVPQFYQSSELTKIYSDGTSLASGGGDGQYYLTTDLNPVAATLYDATSANTHNADLTGARSEGYEEKYTEEEALAHNAALDGAVKEGDAKPSPGNYTADEAKEYNAKLDGAVKEGDTKPAPEEGTYTDEQAATYNAALPGAVTTETPKPSPGNYNAEEAATHNAGLTGAVSTSTTKKTYTADDANAYNATLDGAVAAGDVLIPAHYVLPDSKTPSNTDKVSHTPGELKSAGNKIMMYITLTDGTRYSIELSKCTDTTSQTQIKEWKRGEHYTYEISLGKEEITFRALIKNWDEKTGSGNATLDWD